MHSRAPTRSPTIRGAIEVTFLVPIRILLTDLPQMLRSIIRDIVADQPDMEVVGELAGPAGVSAMVAQSGATFVIVRHSGSDPPDVFRELLAGRPPTRVLAIADEGRAGTIYELRPQRIPIGELSASSLIAAIRGVPPNKGR
jgi:DNA-binding NarL/FixJ family response regulator